ncbi:unnamed protein product [Clonostachys solani]|uniref:Major facilitator superfamily (MFS) profile domain-containing protein n=1 Tax=Clonostachys solani TaxID=160281 RepID=A0A9N9WAP9_9HYPO|nr:unnamed protein product [Clonostachys solani]
MSLLDKDNQTQPKGAHLEVIPNEMSEPKHDDNGIVNVAKSKFDDLSVGQTLWTFHRVVLVSLAVYTGFVCEGFELKIGNNILANKGFIKQFGTRGGKGVEALDPTWVSTWTSLLNVGQIITFLYIPWYSDRFGRKACFYLSWLWLAVGCVFLNVAQTPSVWALGKLCNGAGVGILQVTCQIYVMEICPNKIRGGMITFQAVWSNIGNITCNVMMQELNKRHPLNYTLPLRILIAPVVLMMFFWAFVPESPWHHTRRGNKEKAMKSLRQLYGGVEGYDFEQEYDIIAKTIQHEKEFMEEEPGFLHVFKGVNLKRTLTVMLLSVCSQFGGLSVVLSYSTYFFDLAGLSDPFLGTLILSMFPSPSCCNLLAVFLWSMTTDTFGRRNFINVCETATCCFLSITGSLWWAGATSGHVPASNALLVLCCLWSFMFQVVNMSYAVMSAELPSAVLRVKTAPVTFFAQSILGISFGYATPRMLLALNIKACFIFGALSVPCCILMWLYVPETKGRSAAEIDELYERKIPAWKWSKTRTSVEDHSLALFTEKE